MSRKPIRLSALGVCTLLLLIGLRTATIGPVSARPARPQLITVTSLADSGPGTLRQAIADAVDGDTITFGVTGTITVLQPLNVSQHIVLDGPGADRLTVDGGDTVRILRISATGDLTLRGLRLAHGVGSDQPAATSTATHTPTQAPIVGVAARSRATSVAGRAGPATTATWSPTPPYGEGSGGAVYNRGRLTVLDCVFERNRSLLDWAGGGAIYSAYGRVDIARSRFVANHADTGDGGGAVFNYGGPMTVADSVFDSNIASNQGGALYNRRADLTVTGSLFTGNGRNRGGAIFSETIEDGELVVANSTFVGNANGLFNFGLALIVHCTFSGNYGSALEHNDGWPRNELVLANTVIQSDYTPCGGDPITDGGGNIQFPGTSCGTSIRTADPGLQTLADNGGPTWTMALSAGSPAVDFAGTAACMAAPVSGVDQRGRIRPVDGNGDGQAACDSGAMELGSLVTATPGPSPTRPPSRTPEPSATWTPSPTATATLQPQVRVTTLAADGSGSLRWALTVVAPYGRISFDVIGIIPVPIPLEVDRPVSIDGPGAKLLTLDGGGTSRVLVMASGARDVNLSGLTIAHGLASGPAPSGGSPDIGGGLLIQSGPVSITDCAVVENSAVDAGGGIALAPDTGLTLRRSLIGGNRAPRGAGLFVDRSANAAVENTTFTGNRADDGGAVYTSGWVSLHHVTLAENEAVRSGASVYMDSAQGGAAWLRNSLLSGSSQGGNCEGFQGNEDDGHNLQYPDSTCGESMPVLDLRLDPLASNGGQSDTLMPQPDSPAIDAGGRMIDCMAVGGVDQRGFVRPIDGNGDGRATCDIGAVEAGSSGPPTPTPTPTVTNTPTPPMRTPHFNPSDTPTVYPPPPWSTPSATAIITLTATPVGTVPPSATLPANEQRRSTVWLPWCGR